MNEVVIVEAVRSAVGRAHKGRLASVRPDELAGEVFAALLARVPEVPPTEVDELILGCAMPEGEQGMNLARIVALLAGLPVESTAMTVNRFCASGLQAVASAAGAIATGMHRVVLAGGVESMSRVPMRGYHFSPSPAMQQRLASVYDPMGITAETLAERFRIPREAQDLFALQSHRKAAAAQQAGAFVQEIVPVQGGSTQEMPDLFAVDETIRSDTTLARLASLEPAFLSGGTVTAGNASPLSDGAAAALLMSRQEAEARGLRPLGYFRACATAGVDPAIMGSGPIPAVRALLYRTGLSMDQIDLFEVNEAFACQALHVQQALEIPDAKLNVGGGALALGHPLGCTGAKLVVTALHALRRRQGRYAVVTLCVGGGMGMAALLEAGEL